jgi:hypothetical protein
VTIRYRFPGFIVWGATARIIESSLDRIVELIDLRNRGMSLCNNGFIENKKE